MSAVTEFKVGQRWKTRRGDVVTITNVDDDSTYPVDADIGCFTRGGRQWSTRESNGDLVELISDENGNLAGLKPVFGTALGRTFRQDLVLALVSGLAAGGATPQHLMGDVNSLVGQLDAKYGDKEAA